MQTLQHVRMHVDHIRSPQVPRLLFTLLYLKDTWINLARVDLVRGQNLPQPEHAPLDATLHTDIKHNKDRQWVNSHRSLPIKCPA